MIPGFQVDSEEGSQAMATTGGAPDSHNRPAGATAQPGAPSPGDPKSPEQPGRGSWYRSGWVIGLAALLVGGGVGAAVGVTAGSSTTTTLKTTTVAGPTRTLTQVRTVTGPTNTVQQVHTVTGPTNTVTRVVRTPAATPSGPTGGGGGGNTFSGTGYQNFGAINVPDNSTLYWQCSCSSVDITSDTNGDGNNITVSSQDTSGQTPVAAGPYNNVQVNADGNYTIAIK
jgi:hypothetical protein